MEQYFYFGIVFFSEVCKGLTRISEFFDKNIDDACNYS